LRRAAVERLQDARHFAVEARQIAFGIPPDVFAESRHYQYAVRYCLLAIGEALRHVPAEIQALAPDIPWRSIINMRHRLAHDYWLTDPGIVLEAAERQAEDLAAKLDRLIARLRNAS
jgi:uncharacterized protein with HEPN domain